MSKKELATTETKALTTVTDMSDWGDVVVEAKDLELPKVLLQQALSASVKERVALDGDYLNTLTGKVCSDKNGTVKVLPFFCRQSYIVDKYNGKKFEFFKSIPYQSGLILPFEEDIDGIRYRNTHVYEFFCMLEEGGTPAVVPFKSTSHRAGKQLFNLMYLQNPEQGKTPAHNWITLGRKEDQNKDGDKYFVMTIAVDRESVATEIESCKGWIKTIKQSSFKVVDERPMSEPVTETRF